MKPLPIIGFDRYIARHWLDTALAIAAGEIEKNVLISCLETEIAGVEARSKTMIIVNRIWLSPHPSLVQFASDGVKIYQSNKSVDTLALHWGMALASHPLFAVIAENTGRLLKLHDEFTALQINRRVKELLGDRASILRAIEAVLQTMIEWKVISERFGRSRVFSRGSISAIKDKNLAAWLIEACLRATERSYHLNESVNMILPFELPPFREADFTDHERIRLTVTGSNSVSIGMRDK